MELPTFIQIIFIVLIIAGMWKVFQKAGRPGWESIIPIYNLYIIQKLIKKPWWWILLMLIPLVGIIWSVWSTNLLMKKFGKSEGYTVGILLLPFVFWPMLGFGEATYDGNEDSQDFDEVIEIESEVVVEE